MDYCSKNIMSLIEGNKMNKQKELLMSEDGQELVKKKYKIKM